MTCPEITKLNEQILLNVHAACHRDMNRACICYNLHRTTAEAIAKISIDTLRKLSSISKSLIYPALIPVETWNNIESLKDDALSTIPLTQIFPRV
jgi:hypothetical protein